MAPPDTEALQEAPEDVMRRVAREEARAVYDELTATDADGESWSLRRLMDSFGLNRRQAIKALGLVAIGYTAPQAVAKLFVGTARADAAGQIGTQADPVQDAFAHEVHAGDGADVITLADAIQHANEAVSTATTIGNVCYIEVDTSVAGFTVTIPATLEASGLELRFVDAGGSAGSNSYDIDSTNWNIDGSATLTVDASDTVTTLYSAGDRWLTSRFIETVDAGTIVTDDATINNVFNLSTPGGLNWTSSNLVVKGANNSISISDDSTATFLTEELTSFSMLITVQRAANVITALVSGRADSTPQADIVAQGGQLGAEVTTSDVSGTTGTDGVFTVSIRDSVIEFENRLGGGADVSALVMD